MCLDINLNIKWNLTLAVLALTMMGCAGIPEDGEFNDFASRDGRVIVDPRVVRPDQMTNVFNDSSNSEVPMTVLSAAPLSDIPMPPLYEFPEEKTSKNVRVLGVANSRLASQKAASGSINPHDDEITK